MSAQVHFDLRREPAEVEMVGLLHEEGRLREIHLPGDGLKPAILFPGRKQADRRRIASEGVVSEGVNVKERDSHLSRFLKRGHRGAVHGYSTCSGMAMNASPARTMIGS